MSGTDNRHSQNTKLCRVRDKVLSGSNSAPREVRRGTTLQGISSFGAPSVRGISVGPEVDLDARHAIVVRCAGPSGGINLSAVSKIENPAQQRMSPRQTVLGRRAESGPMRPIGHGLCVHCSYGAAIGVSRRGVCSRRSSHSAASRIACLKCCSHNPWDNLLRAGHGPRK